MRRLFSLLAVASLIAGAVTASHAAFTTVSKSTVTASINFTAVGSVSISYQLSSGSSIGWSGVTPGTSKWVAASNYIILHSTITHTTGGVQIYTDNTDTASAPRYAGAAGTNPAGLVGYDAGKTSGTVTLPMCWRITDVSTTSLTIVQGTDNKLYSQQLGGQASLYACFLWMKDKATPDIPENNTTAFLNGEDYVTMKESARGIHHGEGDWGASPSPDYIYLGANFQDATTPKNYGATIRVEAFYE